MPASTFVLKEAKINENVWTSTVQKFLPFGKLYIERAAMLSVSSPFTFTGAQTRDEILAMYKEAASFASTFLSKKHKFYKLVED